MGLGLQADSAPRERASFGSISVMRAARVTGPRRVEIEKIPLPVPGPREVRIRVEGCGLCGSNLASWQGRPWFRYPLEPGACGHEGWGEIDAVGKQVRDVRPGERIAFLSSHAFAEYDLADAAQLVGVPRESRVFPGEALGCAANIIRRSAVEAGQTVALIGVGFLGALLLQLAVRQGARVIAISRRPFALEMARRLGAQASIPFATMESVTEKFRELCGKESCERVIEATGTQPALDLASALVGERGRLVVAGYHQDGARRVNMQLWNWRGIDVINAHERDPQVCLEGMREAASAIEQGRLDPQPLYTHSVALDRLGDAFDLLEHRPEGFLKVWIRIAE